MITSLETLRAELEATRASFHDLLNSIPDQALEFKEPGNAWRIKAELWHITQSLGFLAPAIIMVHRGRPLAALYLRFPVGVRSWINGYILVPFLTRHVTRQEIAGQYDRAHQRILVELDRPGGDKLKPGAKTPLAYPGIADLFHQPAEHFQLHADRIKQNLKDWNTKATKDISQKL